MQASSVIILSTAAGNGSNFWEIQTCSYLSCELATTNQTQSNTIIQT